MMSNSLQFQLIILGNYSAYKYVKTVNKESISVKLFGLSIQFYLSSAIQIFCIVKHCKTRLTSFPKRALNIVHSKQRSPILLSDDVINLWRKYFYKQIYHFGVHPRQNERIQQCAVRRWDNKMTTKGESCTNASRTSIPSTTRNRDVTPSRCSVQQGFILYNILKL